MNDAKLQLDAGNLSAAVDSALKLVKTNPTDATARTFLFELSCFAGDWDRAEKQLDVIGHPHVTLRVQHHDEDFGQNAAIRGPGLIHHQLAREES